MTTLVTETDDERELQPPSRWSRLGLAAPAYLPAVMIAVGGWQHRWMDEDAFINLRIVDQIFAGHGPVFNAGERVEAATSTVWLAVLVFGRAVFGSFASMEWITLLASLCAAVAAFVVAGKATRLLHLGENGLVIPVGLILVASPSSGTSRRRVSRWVSCGCGSRRRGTCSCRSPGPAISTAASAPDTRACSVSHRSCAPISDS